MAPFFTYAAGAAAVTPAEEEAAEVLAPEEEAAGAAALTPEEEEATEVLAPEEGATALPRFLATNSRTFACVIVVRALSTSAMRQQVTQPKSWPRVYDSKKRTEPRSKVCGQVAGVMLLVKGGRFDAFRISPVTS